MIITCMIIDCVGSFQHDACEYSPASSPYVINVGATEMENGEDKVYQSNFGTCVSLYAPGENK